MSRSDNLYALPTNLPVPTHDGACQHLTGMRLPSIALRSTSDRAVNLAEIKGWVVIYCYPRTGLPHQDPPAGWNDIPGARGCTPQSCAFRDHFQELQRLGAQVFGLSAQDTAYQTEAVARLHLPFELLSDSALAFAAYLNLPTFEIAGMTLLKRVTLIARSGVIEKVFYPVFPPDRNAEEVIDWLAREQEPRFIVQPPVCYKKEFPMDTQDIYQKLSALLDEANARYRVVEHAPEGQTELVSQMRGNLLSQAVKSLVVLVKVGKKERRYFLVNIPGNRRANLNAVKALCGGTHVMFAPAEKARELTGCEMGAVPPFSFHENLTLLLDPALLEHTELVFNAGRLDRSIFVHRDDYLKLARPVLAHIS